MSVRKGGVPLSSAIAMLNLVRFHRNVFRPTRTPQIIRLNYTVPPESPTTTPQRRRQRGSNNFQLRGMSFREAAGSVSLCLDESSQRMISFFCDSNVGVFLGRLARCQRKFLPKLWAETIRKKKCVTGDFGRPVKFLSVKLKKKMMCQPEVCLRHLGETPDDQISLANLGWNHWCWYPVSH